MILVADSGSTKTDWRLVDQSGKTIAIETEGINPYFRSKENISEEISRKLLPIAGDKLDAVFFYGAGIINQAVGDVVKESLLHVFNVLHVEINSDVLGAARALFYNEPGIVCILGTGSNASLYDGKMITDRIPSLGFVLGDEGSGASMGRQVVSDYLKRQIPDYLLLKLNKQFKIKESDVLEKVYKKERPNQYLATFTTFLKEYISEPYCHDLVYKSFLDFFVRNIQVLKSRSTKNIGVVGSVGFVFQEVFSEVASTFGYKDIHYLKDPIDQLADFHLKNFYQI